MECAVLLGPHCCRLGYGGNQPVTHLGDGFYDLRVLTIIAEGPANLVDGIGQRLIADDDLRPHFPKQFLATERLSRMSGQIAK